MQGKSACAVLKQQVVTLEAAAAPGEKVVQLHSF